MSLIRLAGSLVIALLGACASPRPGMPGDGSTAGTPGAGGAAGSAGPMASTGGAAGTGANAGSGGPVAGSGGTTGAAGASTGADSGDQRPAGGDTSGQPPGDGPSPDTGPPPECRMRTDCPSPKSCIEGRCQLAALHITAGAQHTCAVLSDGTLRCWGDNEAGQAGTGTFDDHPAPAPVIGLANVERVIAGRGRNSCALLGQGGGTSCWGAVVIGQPIDVPHRRSPVAVVALADAKDLVIGEGSGCALRASAVECWGYNASGQLGNGRTDQAAFTDQPSRVVDLAGVTALSGGVSFNCAVASGSVLCWGANTYGQLGDGTTQDSPRPVRVSGLPPATALVSGISHTCALLAGSGAVRCWGSGTRSELGDGSASDSALPVAAAGLSGVVALAAGSIATCAALADGSARCWGTQTGVPGGVAMSPQMVPGLTGVRSLAVGGAHICALIADGGVKCWGNNGNGQLGSGNYGMPVPPVPASVTGW